MFRGIERRIVFTDDRDRSDLLTRLERILGESDIACFGFALMPNHVHLILRTGALPLSHAMSRIGTGYVGYFNRRHDRPGHLFQNRYKALIVEDDVHLRTLVRYVHLNPVRAGLVRDEVELESYGWTGHSTLVGRANARFLAVDAVLGLFGDTRAAARTALRAWMRQARADDGAGTPLRPSLPQIIDVVARELGIAVAEIRGGVRRREIVRARAIVAYLACDGARFSHADVAPHLGVGDTAMARARSRGETFLPQCAPGLIEIAKSWSLACKK